MAIIITEGKICEWKDFLVIKITKKDDDILLIEAYKYNNKFEGRNYPDDTSYFIDHYERDYYTNAEKDWKIAEYHYNEIYDIPDEHKWYLRPKNFDAKKSKAIHKEEVEYWRESERDDEEYNKNKDKADNADDNEADDNEADDNEADDNEADDNEADDNEADDNESDDNESDDNEADDNEADDNEADDNESDDNEADDNEPDDNESDDNESDDNESDDKELQIKTVTVDNFNEFIEHTDSPNMPSYNTHTIADECNSRPYFSKYAEKIVISKNPLEIRIYKKINSTKCILLPIN